MQQLTAVDLFSGCGGISWGLHKAGFKILAGVDVWKPALQTFQLNHQEAQAIFADLTDYKPSQLRTRLSLDPGELDCLVGGPPCQGFSKNVPAAYRFLDDPRNQLFREFLAFVTELRPKTVVMENVAEIFNAYSGMVRLEIIDRLNELGYEVEVKVILSSDYGIPQHRRRCIFFASRTGIRPHFPAATFGNEESQTLFGRIRKYRSAWSAISDLPCLENGEGYEPMQYDKPAENDYQAEMRLQTTELYDHVTRKLNDKQFSRLSALAPGEGIKQLPDNLRPKSGYSGAYGRLDFENPSPTITRWVFHPGSGRFSHPQNTRLITIREAARIQSFSDDFRFTGTYIEKAHQIGNAVPPLLVQQLAQSVKTCLRRSE